MENKNHRNPESDQSQFSKSKPIQPSHEEVLRLLKNLSTNEIGNVQNGSPSLDFLTNSAVFSSGTGIGSVSVSNLGADEIIGFHKQRHMFMGSSSTPTLQSAIPTPNSLGDHDGGSIIGNSISFGSRIGTSFVRNAQTQITGSEEPCLGMSGWSRIPRLQPPLELQRYYPQQNMSVPTMWGPNFSLENTFHNGDLPTDYLNVGLDCHGSAYCDFVQDIPNSRLQHLGNQCGLKTKYPNPFIEQNSSSENTSLAATIRNYYYYPSGQISMFNANGSLNNWSYQKVQKICNGDPSLLDEVRSDELFMMAKHELGSNYLVTILNHGEPFSVKKIIHGIRGCIVPLMSDPYGNRIFQKVLELSCPNEIKEIAEMIIAERDGLIKAASDRIGIYSIKKLVSVLKKTNLLGCVMSTLRPKILKLMMNRIGSHLIQFFLESLDYEQNQPIFEVATDHYVTLATNKQGCLTLKLVMDTIRNSLRDKLLLLISRDAVNLSKDPYGNYVLQHVLKFERMDFPITSYICRVLKGHYTSLSKNKHGSRVIEECISTEIGLQIAFLEFQNSDKLIVLAIDPFGNYVIQKALKITMCREYDHMYLRLVNVLRRHSKVIENHPQGSNVYKLLKNSCYL